MKSVIGGLFAAFIVVVGLSAVFGSWYTIDQGEKGVLLTNGALTSVVDPGLHFKMPFFQDVQKISLRQQVIGWTCIPDKGCATGERSEMQAYSKDQQPANIRVTVNFHVPIDEVANAYSTYGSVEALADRVIARKAPQAIKTVFGQYDAVSVIQKRAEFNAAVNDAIAKAIDGPVTIDGVQVENIDFSDAYESAVEARMTAQVEVQKQEQTLQQEQIKAKIAVTQAQGRADSVKAEADATAYATKIQGEAQATAIKARADALAANAALVELTKAEKWNGILPTTMLPQGTVPFLDVAPAK